jgi:hypothetical protein
MENAKAREQPRAFHLSGGTHENDHLQKGAGTSAVAFCQWSWDDALSVIVPCNLPYQANMTAA